MIGVDMNGNTPLHIAAATGDIATLRLHIGDAEMRDAKNIHGATPLFFAASKGHAAIVQELIAAGANLNSANEHDVTPLFMAAREGYEAVAELLLKAGANPFLANVNSVTPVDIAADRGHKKLALLIASYANKIKQGGQDVAVKLIKKGKVAAVDKKDGTPPPAPAVKLVKKERKGGGQG